MPNSKGRCRWRAFGLAPVLVIIALGAGGCETPLMPTPNIYVDGRYPLFADHLNPELRRNKADLLYVTDRGPEPTRDGRMRYGWKRSASLAFGSCVVEFGKGVSWETLVEESTTRNRRYSLPMTVQSITEIGRLAPTPLPQVESEGRLVIEPAALASQQELAERFLDEVRRRLALTPVKEAFIYVHGFNNTFDYAAGVLAEFWHFGGRPGVPILYTWPSGAPGLLKGYNHDRESGEFTIFHLKQFIRALAQAPEIQKIHIVAHSRGTDVLASALRELLIEQRCEEVSARERFKIGQVVLASPDVDIDVMVQRFAAEQFHECMERLTIYVSKNDTAIGLANWLFGSRQRLGQLRPESLDESARASLAQVGRTDIIDAQVKTGFLGHSYYHSSPAVSSDLILAMRGIPAGSAQRPLKPAAPHYWVIDSEQYPFGKEKE